MSYPYLRWKDKKHVCLNDHYDLQTFLDNKQIRLNTRTFLNTTGDAIAFSSTPAQGATSTGEIFGAQIKPRVNDGFSVGGLKGLGIDTELKGTGATTTTGDMANINTYLGTGGASNVTGGHVATVRARAEVQNAMAANKHLTFAHILNHEGSTAWSGLYNLPAALGTHSMTTNADKTGNAKVGTIKVIVDNTVRHIQLYADA